jgi:chromatin remodeling complex protein RSC6
MASGKEKSTKATTTKKSTKKPEEETEPQVEKKTKASTKKAEKPEKQQVKKSAGKDTKDKDTKASKSSDKKSSKSKEESKSDDKNEVQLKFAEQFTAMQEQYKTLKEGLQLLGGALKKMEAAYNHDIKKTKKHKQKRNGPHKPTGFAKPQKVPSKLAKFIGVEAGDELTGPDITSKVWDQIKKRNLTYDKDKRVFRTNKEVSELFDVPKTVNNSTNHRDEKGFNFCNLQKYIKNALHKE